MEREDDTQTKEITPELLNEVRRKRLLHRWAGGGRLSKAEVAEIKHLLPADNAAAVVPVEAAPVIGNVLHYQKKLRDYCGTFSTKLRAIKYWVAAGKAANVAEKLHECDPKHLPPLDEPPRMANWWTSHMAQKVPAKLLAIALDAAQTTQRTGINVKELELMSDDAPLAQASRYLAAADANLQAAYLTGDESQIQRCARVWEKAAEAWRVAKRDARAAAKSDGEYVSKTAIAADLAHLVELLRNMRETMPRRVLAQLGDMPPETAGRIGAAVKAVRENEDALLRRLPGIQSAAELELIA